MINHNATYRRQKRVRAKLSSHLGHPRLSIHRTLRHIWAQIIDDKHGKTIVSSSTKVLSIKGTKTEQAKALGTEIAKLAQKQKIVKIRFDRGQFRYHGRVKAVAESAREAGLKF